MIWKVPGSTTHCIRLSIPKGKRLGVQGELNGLALTRRERHAPESLQLLDRPRH